MKSKLEKISDTRVKITVTLDGDDLKKARKPAIERLAKDLKLPGFRAGKVPVDVAEKHLDPAMLEEHILDIAVRQTVPRAFDEVKELALAIPKVDVVKYVAGEMAEYTAEADVLPEIKLGDYTKLKVKKEKAKITDSEVEDILKNVKQGYAEKKAVKRKAKMGDEVLIDFTGKKDGKAFQGGSAKNYSLTLGSKTFIPGFEEGIVGHEPGDEFDISLTFPKDYGVKDLAGQDVIFTVLIKQVNEIDLPEENDEFAKKCGPFKNMDELRADIRKNLESQAEYRAEEKFKDDLVTELVKKSTVSAPEVMVQDQVRMITNDAENNARSANMSLDKYIESSGMKREEWEKKTHELAETRVKASLCLQVLARDENIIVEDDLVDEKMAELKQAYKKSPEAMKNLRDPRVRQDVKNRMTVEKTIEFLAEKNK